LRGRSGALHAGRCELLRAAALFHAQRRHAALPDGGHRRHLPPPAERDRHRHRHLLAGRVRPADECQWQCHAPLFRAQFRSLTTHPFSNRFRPSNLVPPRPLLVRFYLSDGLHKSRGFRERDERSARIRLLFRRAIAVLVRWGGNGRTLRTAPERRGLAWRDMGSRAPERAERQSATRTVVEGMMLSAKLLSIGRGAEFADSNIPSRLAGPRPFRPRAIARAADLSASHTSPMLHEPAQSAQPTQRTPGRPTAASGEHGRTATRGEPPRTGPRDRPTSGMTGSERPSPSAPRSCGHHCHAITLAAMLSQVRSLPQPHCPHNIHGHLVACYLPLWMVEAVSVSPHDSGRRAVPNVAVRPGILSHIGERR
jgi:hypothetical protein